MSEYIIDPERFSVLYRIKVPQGGSIEEIARDITIEQTVEIPFDCIPEKHIEEGLIGRVESCINTGEQLYDVEISFRCDITAFQIPQFLNVIYGNISLKSNIQIVDLTIPRSFSDLFPGPSWGIEGIRRVTGVKDRPLACTALKPMGLQVDELVAMAEAFCRGGVDLIKDDHGITDQPFHSFEERVSKCAEAVERVNRDTGGRTLYFPSMCGTFDNIEKQVRFALNQGIKGLLIPPMLVGFDTVRYIVSSYGMIIMAHPAFTGSFFAGSNQGITPGVLLGKLFRLIGADISVFPSWGGRFPFSKQDCTDLATALREKSPFWKRAFPCPAGGMDLDRLKLMEESYGDDTILLIGGALLRRSKNLSEASAEFMQKVRSLAQRRGDLFIPRV